MTAALDFETAGLRRKFFRYFKGQVSLVEPDITIGISFADAGDKKEVPNSLFLTKIPAEKGFVTGDGLLEGFPGEETNHWNFRVNSLLIQGDYKRVFEQILYQAFYSVTGKRNLHLIHSSGVIWGNKGFLFFGPSEAGKSTVASLSRRYHVINDEINIVDLEQPVPQLTGTPFNGLFRGKKRGQAPLKGIFLLNKAPCHNVTLIEGSEAVRNLSKEIIPPVGLSDFIDAGTYAEMLDRATEICSRVPVYRLDFLPDKGFWEILKKL